MTTAGKKRFSRALRRDKYLIFMILPAFVLFVLFCYLPMFGVVMAFQNFTPGLGFLHSPWVGLRWFQYFVKGAYFGRLLRNTALLSLYSILFGTPATLLFTLLLNEIRCTPFKRVVQTVTYLPYFISTVIMVSMLKMLLAYPGGVVNQLLTAVGVPAQNFFQEQSMFRSLYVGSGVWQGLGWSSILYLAALTAINPELYEAAYMDGASRFQRVLYVDLPAILPTVSIMLILAVGGIMSIGADKALLMQNSMNLQYSEIISTYEYKVGLSGTVPVDFSLSTAIGLFNSIVNFILLLTADKITKKLSGSGIL